MRSNQLLAATGTMPRSRSSSQEISDYSCLDSVAGLLSLHQLDTAVLRPPGIGLVRTGGRE